MRIRWPAIVVLGSLFLAVMAAFHAFARQTSQPDLIIDRQRLLAEWAVSKKYFPPGDCTIVEGCVLAPGMRKLLTFAIQTANISQTTLFMGDPTSNPNYEFSPCHGHYHLLEFSDYQIATPGGGPLVTARKQDWCLADVEQYIFEPWVPQTGFHDCDNQGMLGGWSDVYVPGQQCQWLDVTDLPVGDYELTAIVNAVGRLVEEDYTNNSVTIPVNVPDLSGIPDLVLDAARIASTLTLDQKSFTASHPALSDLCVGSFGTRRLIRFDTAVGNLGPSDLYLGDPAYQSRVTYSSGHSHYHLDGFLRYQLFDLNGNAVTPARGAINWVPADKAHYVDAPWVHPGMAYWAPLAGGVQRGWYALNARTNDCQWVDVSFLPDGRYRLRATVNPTGIYTESDLTNNTVEVDVTLTASSLGIAHRPDGSFVPGTPLSAYTDPGGTRIEYDVDPATCPAVNYNVYYGNTPPGSYAYTGAVCNVGNTGSAVIPLPNPPLGGLLWFNIVGREGASEGGHGFDSQGQARPLSGVGFCGITQTLPQTSCPAP